MTEHKTDMNIQKTRYDGTQNRYEHYWNWKTKKLIMTEHKTNMNITKYKKLNMTESKTDINIAKIEKYNKKNWTALLWQSTKQTWTLLKNWAPLLQPNLKTPHKMVNENIQSTNYKYTLSIPITEKSEECEAI